MLNSITTLLRNNFARRILNKSVPKKLQELQDNEIKQIQQQFEPLSKKILMQKQKLRQQTFKQLSYVGEDPSPHKLVNRPSKGAVWGLGGQLILAQKKVQLQGLKDDTDQIINFLELHQVKNIYFHDWMANDEQNANRRRYSLIGSCFSAKHCWKTGIEVKNAFNKNVIFPKNKKSTYIKNDLITAVMVGKKDEQWAMVQYKDYQIHLMTEEQRQAIDLQWKWNNPVPEETIDKWSALNNNRKKRKNQFQDFD